VWHVVVVIPSRLAGMGHVAITFVYRVARARVCIGWRTATALDNIISFALPFPLTRSPSSFSLPVMVTLSVTEFSVTEFSVTELSLVLALGCSIIADAGSHPLMAMNLIGTPRAGGRTRV
jgi:hypothetical protein